MDEDCKDPFHLIAFLLYLARERSNSTVDPMATVFSGLDVPALNKNLSL